LEHEVEAVFEDGLVLRKVYYEKWTRKKGAPESEFSGHTTDYYIDGVPSKKTEYTAKIDSIVKEDIFKLLSNPLHFNTQLHWQDRRKILFTVCGDISDSEVISDRHELSELSEIVGKRSIDEHKKMIASKLKEINQELDRIPTRISENQKSLEGIDNLSKSDLLAAIEVLQVRKNEKAAELSLLENGGEAAVNKKAAAEIEAEMMKIKNHFEQKKADARIQVHKNTTELNRLVSDKMMQVSSLEMDIASLNKQIESIKSSIEEKRGQFLEEDAKIATVGSHCPTCKQALPKDQVADAVKVFNVAKSATLIKINDDGKALKLELEAGQKLVAEKMEKLKKVSDDYRELQIRMMDKVPEDVRTVEEVVPEYNTLAEKRSQLLAATLETNEEQKLELRKAIANISVEILNMGTQVASVDASEKTLTRIAELKQQNIMLADEHREWSRQAYLCDEFVRTKTELVTSNINNKFKLARFRLFTQNINGGIEESCDVMYDGVPYNDLNNAMKINIGCDVINTLSKHYDVQVPVFVDNAESVVDMYKLESQMVQLVVSGTDDKLRVEADS
jgi:chromosome segregation ATPase